MPTQLNDLIYIETYNDHRIAMSMSLFSSMINNLNILDKKCVNKTYPNYLILISIILFLIIIINLKFNFNIFNLINLDNPNPNILISEI